MTTVHERPGVYSQFEASGIISTRSGARPVGVVGACFQGDEEGPVLIVNEAQAVSTFGAASSITAVIQMALRCGATRVHAVGIQGEVGEDGTVAPDLEAYVTAFAALGEVEDLAVVVCDSEDLSVQQALRESVRVASEGRRERIGVVGITADNIEAYIERAEGLQSERMVLVAPSGVTKLGAAVSGAVTAAAVAGAIAQNTDPSLPLSGATLAELSGLVTRYNDNEIDALILGGVTPLEAFAGQVSVIRAVTTRTKTDGSEDATWRELSTILIADTVMSGLRNVVRTQFSRAKNTAQTRDAIRSLVILELENFKAREVIDGYQNVTVTQSEESPTVCRVNFSFAVAHALNQIVLTAFILV